MGIDIGIGIAVEINSNGIDIGIGIAIEINSNGNQS